MGSASSTLIEVSPLFELLYASSGFSYSRELILAGHRSVRRRGTFYFSDGNMANRAGTAIQ
ncbi:MAG: hypothetical protein KGJ08_05510 [Gammaproteobacteria bacterium]|nr:hypothetical protein [Gammaproteobacteria bacterium]